MNQQPKYRRFLLKLSGKSKAKGLIPSAFLMTAGLVILSTSTNIHIILLGIVPAVVGNLVTGIQFNAAIKDFIPEGKAGLFQGIRMIFTVLIPMNNSVKCYDNHSAAMFLSGTYKSGIIVTKCDGYGNFDFGDRFPEGKYIILIVSKNTTAAGRFNNEENWKTQITNKYGSYFSDEDLDTLMLFMGFNSLASGTITVEKGRVNTITHDFGYTYI